MFPYSSYIILQTRNSHHKIDSIGSVFSYDSSFLFSSHALAWACILHLKFQSVLVSFISQLLLNRFQYNLYYYLPYACSTSTTMFRFFLSLVIPEHTLHRRVKDSIAHSSTIICSSNFKRGLLYGGCTNVNCDSVTLCNTIILAMCYAEFFKVCFNGLNGLDLFILLMHIFLLKQVHVIHTYICYCFILEYTLSTNYATNTGFWCLDTQFL